MHRSTTTRFVTLFVIALVYGSKHALAQYGYGGHGLGILPSYAAAGYGLRTSNIHFPGAPQLSGYGGGGSRLGTGYIGNPGIGIRQSGATLANLYGLPQSLAQAPAPRTLTLPTPPNPYLQGPVLDRQLSGPRYAPGLLNGAHFGGGYLG